MKNLYIYRIFHLVEHHTYCMAGLNIIFCSYLIPSSDYHYFLSKLILKKLIYSISVSMMISGTLGNYIDRLFRGYVVDFLSFHFGSYIYPTFNIADSLLVVGVILFCFDILFLEHKRTKKHT